MHAVLLFLLQSSSTPPAVYDGRLHQIDVRLPRIDAPGVVIDGNLDDPGWHQAAVLKGFTQYRPVDSRPAADSTEVLAFYAPDAIYFGIRAYEGHGSVVRATLADRDNIDADDKVEILLDTFHDRRRALLFAVNPLGAQQDGVRSEGLAGAAGGQNAGFRFDGVVDLNPDYIYESRGHLTPFGYEVEIRIPFKSLRYQSGETQDWGIQFIRTTQHTGYEDTWTPVVRASASFLIQSGSLKELTGLRRGLVMDVTPEFTARVDGAAVSATDYQYQSLDPEVGVNVRWGITHDQPRLLAGGSGRRAGDREPALCVVLSGKAALLFGGTRAIRHTQLPDLYAPDHEPHGRRQTDRQGRRHGPRVYRRGGR
jgi:hypothetical protein